MCLSYCEWVSEIPSKELSNCLPPVATTGPERRGFSAPENESKLKVISDDKIFFFHVLKQDFCVNGWKLLLLTQY